MAVFYYKATNESGQTLTGTIDGATPEAVAGVLAGKKMTVLEISEKSPLNSILNNLDIFNKVKSKDLVVFFRQLSVMLEASLPLVKALRILAKQGENEKFKAIITGLADEVDGGNSLSASMEFYPAVFTKFYVNIIKSGETSGRLAEVMIYLADQKEKDYDIEARVKGAMIYPAFIIAVLVVVAFIVVAFVIPNITGILKESGAELPFITQVLVWLSEFVRAFWWVMILLTVIIAGLWFYWIKTESGRWFYDNLKLRIPIFGTVFRNIYIVRICRSFATLVKGGVPVAAALVVVRDVVDNVVYEDILSKTIKSVDEGNQVSESLAESQYIPSIVAQMIAVGEESGKLEEVLDQSAEFYSREIDNTVRNLSNLIEPIIMVFLGIAVGIFVLAVILPMWQLSSSL
jgi:type II secretory pathway component PulF